MHNSGQRPGPPLEALTRRRRCPAPTTHRGECHPREEAHHLVKVADDIAFERTPDRGPARRVDERLAPGEGHDPVQLAVAVLGPDVVKRVRRVLVTRKARAQSRRAWAEVSWPCARGGESCSAPLSMQIAADECSYEVDAGRERSSARTSLIG